MTGATSQQAGFVAAGLEPLRDAFIENFTERGELGSACCVFRDGRVVADLWGGVANTARGQPWQRATPVPVFSATKGITASCVALLINDGALDVDLPVCYYWPEFAQNGKQDVTVRDVLCHRAGLPAVTAALPLQVFLHPQEVAVALAGQAQTTNNHSHGYHTRTWGWLVAEVVRRVTGASVGKFFRERLAQPLRLQAAIGLPSGALSSVATLEFAISQDSYGAGEGGRAGSSLMLSEREAFGYDDRWMTAAFLTCEIPSSNGVTSGRDLAKLYAAVSGQLAGHPILEPATVAAVSQLNVDGFDQVLGVRTTFGLGFALPPMLNAYAPEGSFGHMGAGGSVGFADPGHGLAFAYVTNLIGPGVTTDPRAESLVRALYESIR